MPFPVAIALAGASGGASNIVLGAGGATLAYKISQSQTIDMQIPPTATLQGLYFVSNFVINESTFTSYLQKYSSILQDIIQENVKTFPMFQDFLTARTGTQPQIKNPDDLIVGGAGVTALPKSATETSTGERYKDITLPFINVIPKIRTEAIAQSNTLAQQAQSYADTYLAVHRLAVSVCSSSINPDCYSIVMDKQGGFKAYRNYQATLPKIGALNEAYKHLIADLIRSMLSQCVDCETIWNSLGDMTQDLFTSQADYQEACQWEREQMAQQEQCCLKRWCCYGVK